MVNLFSRNLDALFWYEHFIFNVFKSINSQKNIIHLILIGFVKAVGTDRNVSQSLLEHRAELLSSLVKLFHHDIQTIYDQFSASNQYKNMSEKLYHIFETYLPILQYNGNIFQNMPISKLPKVSEINFVFCCCCCRVQ